MSALRIAFMGTPDFSCTVLEALLKTEHEIVCVYSQPPRRAGRGKSLRPTPVHQLAEKHGIDVRTPASLKVADEQTAFTDLNLDVAIVVAYGLILPKAVLDASKFGCLNLHASLLPRWRGAAPIQRAIMAGDTMTGAGIMQMAAGLDTGDVLAEFQLPITSTTTAGELHDALAVSGAELMVETISKLGDGSLKAVPQPEEGITYAHKIDKQEARISWDKSAAELSCHIRGLSPFPGAYFEHGGTRIKILNACVTDGGGKPGEVLDDVLTVACGTGALQLTLLQRSGKSPMDTKTFLNGFPLVKGTMLS